MYQASKLKYLQEAKSSLNLQEPVVLLAFEPIQEMKISHGGLDIVMPHNLLDGEKITAVGYH